MRNASSTAGRSLSESVRHAPGPNAAADMLPGGLAPVVIVPTHAAEADILARLLDSHPQVFARSEGLGSSAESVRDVRGAMKSFAESAMREAGMSLRRGAQSPLRIACCGLAEGDVESLESVIRSFPRVQALCVLRDGRDAIVDSRLSTLRARKFDGLSVAARTAAERAAAFLAESRAGAPAALFCQESLRLHTMRWIASLRAATRATELLREQARIVRQEDLAQEAIRTHASTCRWLGVAGDSAHIHSAVEGNRRLLDAIPRPGIWRSTLSESDKAAFKRMAGELLIELGYAADTRW